MASVSAWSALLLVACASANEPPHEAPKVAPDPWAATAPAPAPKSPSKNTDDCSSILSDDDAKALGYTRRIGECTDFHHSLELVAGGRVIAHVGVIHGMDKQVVFDRPLADARQAAARNDPTATHTLSENLGLGDESFLLETRPQAASEMLARQAKLAGIPAPVQAAIVARKGDYSINVTSNNFQMGASEPVAIAKQVAGRVISKL